MTARASSTSHSTQRSGLRNSPSPSKPTREFGTAQPQAATPSSLRTTARSSAMPVNPTPRSVRSLWLILRAGFFGRTVGKRKRLSAQSTVFSLAVVNVEPTASLRRALFLSPFRSSRLRPTKRSTPSAIGALHSTRPTEGGATSPSTFGESVELLGAP